MTKKMLIASFIVMGGLIFGGCSPVAPVYNVANSPVQGNNKKLTQAQVEQAILKAGMGRGWKMTKVKNGLIEATYYARGHMAVVEIKYSASSYSITHKDSTNLKYDGNVIHRNYNGWIQNLDRDIQNNLLLI